MKKNSILIHFIFFFLFLLLPSLFLHAQLIGTSPIEYNPEKFIQSSNSMYDENDNKTLYPLGSNNYYIFDTISLPFVDDFSTNKIKKYNTWDLPTAVDSTAKIYTIQPVPAAFPFNYSLTTTYSYFPNYTTTPPSVDSLINNSFTYITYGDNTNPFIPMDTLILWEINTKRFYYDTATSTIDSLLIFPDGTLTDDSTQLIHVYFPNNDGALWIDNFAYINNSMAVNPPTIGVVTFDGTNEFGKAYVPGGVSSFGANDCFTSKPIHLNYPASDSIYLSFFYQPQGIGYEPAPKDSLVVEFYDVDQRTWIHILNIPGDTSTAFKQKLIPITNARFLKSGFQFRFKNWGNRSGNMDHWNIDYVRLDRLRNINDTLIDDVAFVYPPASILRRYREMPYTQFTQLDVDPKWENYMTNLSNTPKEICYKFIFSDQDGNVLNRYTEDYTPLSSDTNFIQPYSSNGYADYPRFIQPDFNYNFQSNGWLPLTDSTTFNVKNYIINLDTDTRQENDTFLLKQRFFSHFAYDDGTAEQAIWLGTLGSMAMKFKNNFPDTLRAVQFYFNPLKDDVSSRYIDIKVWSDLTPSTNELYTEKRQIKISPNDTMAYINPMNNGYSTYILEEPIALPAGDFYVGWYQNQTFKINLGFDKNTNSKQYSFYKTTGTWDTLSLDGSLMIRPILGSAIKKSQIGWDDLDVNEQVIVFPNPADEFISIQWPSTIQINEIVLFDINGKQVQRYANPQTHTIDVSELIPGVYIIRCQIHQNEFTHHKIIIH